LRSMHQLANYYYDLLTIVTNVCWRLRYIQFIMAYINIQHWRNYEGSEDGVVPEPILPDDVKFFSLEFDKNYT